MQDAILVYNCGAARDVVTSRVMKTGDAAVVMAGGGELQPLQLVVHMLLLCVPNALGDRPPAAVQARNILLIVVDDLRPQMKTYGVPWMHTPNFDKLADQGVLFENAYVQQSICSPTRNSFLSGRYPDKTKVWCAASFSCSDRCNAEQPGDNNAPQTHRAMHTTNRNFIDDFRTSNADGLSWTALPEFFRNHGFFTTGDTPLAPVESICTDAADLRAAAFGFVLSFTALQVLGKSITREFTA